MTREFFKHTDERKIICDDPPAEISLPDQLPDVPPLTPQDSLERVRKFCQERKNTPLQKEPDKNHRETVRALESVASEIYASHFLLPQEACHPVEIFSEVALGKTRHQEPFDLVLVGLGGTGLIEVKPAGSSAGPQLERGQAILRRRFPHVPCFTMKATYWAEGRKLRIALYNQES